MIRSIAARPLPALMLAMLAVWGLLLRGQAIPMPDTVVALYGTPCHAGDARQHGPGHPQADCDTCPLCQAVAGDHGAILTPSVMAFAVAGLASRSLAMQVTEAGFGRPQNAPRARAPPKQA
nr:hypothetical protein [uncultured Rhodopila sp.]